MTRPRRQDILDVCAFVMLAMLAYAPAMRGGFVWDDDDYIVNNPALRAPGGLATIWLAPVGVVPQYYPLVFSSFWLEHWLWGLNPLGYHVVNIGLHGVNAALLWLVLRRLRVPGAKMAAAVFAVHPVCVESVAWITERKNVLSAMFYLMALFAYLRFAGGEVDTAGLAAGASSGARRLRRWYAAAFACFLCALGSKTVTFSLPAAILLIFWWRRGRLGAADIMPLIPFFLAGAALTTVTLWMEKHNVGALGPAWDLSWAQRSLIAGRALWFYAGKLAWPAGLAFFYPRWNVDAADWGQYVCPAAAAIVVVGLWASRRRIGRGPLAAVLFFGGTLVPALGFFDVYPMIYSFVADHFQYHASVGLIVLAVAAVTRGLGRSAARRRAARVLSLSLLAALGVLAWRQAEVYRGLGALWRDTIRKNPGAWAAHTNLSAVYAEAGLAPQAIVHCDAALRLVPDDAKSYNNRAFAHRLRGDYGQAIRDYSRAVELAPSPYLSEVYEHRAQTFLEMKRFEDAARDCDKAIELRPDSPSAHYTRAIARYWAGDYAGARADVQTCLHLGGAVHPEFEQALRGASGRAR